MPAVLVVLFGGMPLPAVAASAPRIAVLLPQTGPFAGYGHLQEQGYQLAEADLARDGSAAEVRYFDSGSPDVAALRTAVLSWHPSVVVGPYHSESAAEWARALETSGLPLMIPSAVRDDLTRYPNTTVFRLSAPSGLLALTAADFIGYKRPGWPLRGIRILAEDSDYARDVVRALTDACLLRQLPPVEVQTYHPQDLPGLVNTLPPPDKVLTIVVSRAVQDSLMLAEAFQDRPLLGFSGGFATSDFQQYARRKNLRLFILNPLVLDRRNAENQAFIERFQAKFRQALTSGDPQTQQVQAYTALTVAVRAALKSQDSGRSLREVLQTQAFETPSGLVRFADFSGYYQQNPSGGMVMELYAGRADPVFPPTLRGPVASPKPVQPKGARGVGDGLRLLLGNQLTALLAILVLGLALGRVQVAGLSLGSSGVLFAALVFGHFHFTIPSEIGNLGLILFIYCVGINAGPSFFSAFSRQGLLLAKLGSFVVLTGMAVTYILLKIFHLPVDLAAGIFAGALTSTPALAAAMDALKDSGSLVSVGYGIAYPFGVIGIVMFVQVLPRLLKQDLQALGQTETRRDQEIERVFVEVRNPALVGKPISDTAIVQAASCQITRVFREGRCVPIQPEMRFEDQQILMLVGEKHNLDLVIDFIGRRCEQAVSAEIEKERVEIVLTSRPLIGRSLADLEVFKKFGVVISRVSRGDMTFVPNRETVLEPADRLTVVGEVEDLKAFAAAAGHREKALYETDLLSLGVGLLAGVVLGMIPLGLPGMRPFTLGFSGGPLLAGLLLGHFGRIGRIGGRIPHAAQNLMRELGLVFFLAQAGVKAGSGFLAIAQQYGMTLFFVGAVVTSVVLFSGYWAASRVLRLGLLETLGGLCGSLTSTPALGAITARTDAQTPVISYATAYPVALILKIICVQLLIALV